MAETKKIQFCFRSSSFENADPHFLCATIPTASPTVTELMKLTNHKYILIEDANILDLRRFHFNILCLLNRSLNL